MNIPESVPLNVEGQYCITCSSASVTKVTQDDKIYYRCEKCGVLNERSLVIDNKIVWWVDDNRRYWHESVGIIVVNEEKKILCLMRRIFPFALAIPAGHLDSGEQSEFAAHRELQEEVNLNPKITLEHLGDFDIVGDSCSRGSDDHRWHLYRYRLTSEAADIMLNDEATEVYWLSISEICNSTKLVTYPLKYIVEKFGEKLVTLSIDTN